MITCNANFLDYYAILPNYNFFFGAFSMSE